MSSPTAADVPDDAKRSDVAPPMTPAFRAGKNAAPDNERSLLRVLVENCGVSGAARPLARDVGFDLRHRVDTAWPGLPALLGHAAFDRRFALHAHLHAEPGHAEVALYRTR